MYTITGLTHTAGKVSLVVISLILFVMTVSAQQRQLHREMDNHNTSGGVVERGKEQDWARRNSLSRGDLRNG
jgi:hypothetical protein